jgi:hypothetical protein
MSYVLKLFILRPKSNGGAMRDRTADLLRAKQALSQLSYSPINVAAIILNSFKRILVETRHLMPTHSPLCEVLNNDVSIKIGRPEWT